MALYLWAVIGVAMLVISMRMLGGIYVAYAILMSIRRSVGYVILERDPVFFWPMVALYVVITVPALVTIYSQIDNFRFRARMH